MTITKSTTNRRKKCFVPSRAKMKILKLFFSILLSLSFLSICDCRNKRIKKYTPDWKSLDSRPLPEDRVLFK